ncbi:MAG TPA: endo-1,4-beta-xylanase [Sphingomonas sp.]|jgi:GH35 family endo-1,4-beta-xylanase
MIRLPAALLCAAMMGTPVWAADPAPAPLPSALVAAKPVDLLPASEQGTFQFYDSVNPKETPGSFKRVRDANGRPVFLATTTKGSTNQYGIGARWNFAGPIANGDVVLVRLMMRAIEAKQETGEAEGLIIVEPNGGGERDATQSFSVGPDWTSIAIPFIAQGDRATGGEKLTITFANLPQSIEFAGLEVLNFGKRAPLSALPVTSFTYAGREAGAAWRQAALARIEATRTDPMIIRVVDRRGRPVPGAKVDAAMTRSEFLWGSAIAADKIVQQGADGDRYRTLVDELFDTVVFDNGLKWPRWRNPAQRRETLTALDWLTDHGKRIKGHTLVWPAWKFSPKDVAEDPDRDTKIGPMVTAHIRDITAATKGKLIGWDVVNEAVHEEDYWKALPRATAAEWFKLARANDPGMQLTFNEYGMLNRSSSPMMIAQVLDFTRMLKTHGAQVDVLGVQAHVGQTPRPPAAVLSDLDLLAVDGQQVQITEYDFNTRDEALQADYTRDFLIALYSHRAVTGFLQWGFWQKAHWKPDAAMFRADWSEKPAAKVWRDYVLGQWKTRVTAPSDAQGTVRAKGHRGWYRITASHGGKTRTLDGWHLAGDTGEARIVLD